MNASIASSTQITGRLLQTAQPAPNLLPFLRLLQQPQRNVPPLQQSQSPLNQNALQNARTPPRKAPHPRHAPLKLPRTRPLRRVLPTSTLVSVKPSEFR